MTIFLRFYQVCILSSFLDTNRVNQLIDSEIVTMIAHALNYRKAFWKTLRIFHVRSQIMAFIENLVVRSIQQNKLFEKAELHVVMSFSKPYRESRCHYEIGQDEI